MQRHLVGAMISFLLIVGCAGGKAPDPVETGNRVAELQSEARALNEARRHSEAIDKLLEASRLAPDDAGIHQVLGATYGFAEDYDSAARSLEKARDLDPSDYRTHGMLGIAYGRQGRFDLAEVEMREVVQITPEDPEAHAWLGLLGYESKNFPLCVEGFGRYIELVEARGAAAVTEREGNRLREARQRVRDCQIRLPAANP